MRSFAEFFGLFADQSRGRPAKKKTTLGCETLEPRLALASVANADPTVVLIDAALMADIPREELAGSRVIAIDRGRDVVDQTRRRWPGCRRSKPSA